MANADFLDWLSTPIPASEQILVKGLKTKNQTAEFINAEGQQVLKADGNDDRSIDITKLNSGVYFVTVKSDELKVYSPMVIIK